MKWLLYLVIVIALLIGADFLIGYALPATTTISRSITLKQPPAALFAVLAEVKNMAQWNRNTEKVEMLPPIDGKEATRQSFKGGMTITIMTAESEPPKHPVRALGDNSSPLVGSWTYEITPTDGGSRVVLTEVATFKNPFLRVMTRLTGPTKYLDEHLQDLAKKFDEIGAVH